MCKNKGKSALTPETKSATDNKTGYAGAYAGGYAGGEGKESIEAPSTGFLPPDAVVNQFNDTSETGGLLINAIQPEDFIQVFTEMVQVDSKEQRMAKTGGSFNYDHRTLFCSYIRTDNHMSTFKGRQLGVVIDWRAVWDIIGLDASDKKEGFGGLCIFEQDAQISKTALDKSPSYGENGGSLPELQKLLQALTVKQIKSKRGSKAKEGNWNEVVIYNAIKAGLRGILWAESSSQMQTLGIHKNYSTVMENEYKKKLLEIWHKVKKEPLKIYQYVHRGCHDQGQYNLQPIGEPGASKLFFKEIFPKSK